ncbi:MAG: hypothetical protein IJD81_08860 [Oscillospiraceae bacterium]|nr:hypothetical protein [Oscillospiraceae bacterium]
MRKIPIIYHILSATKILLIFFALLVMSQDVLSVAHSGGISDIAAALFPHNIYVIISFGALTFLYVKAPKQKHSLWESVVCFLFSGLLILGHSYEMIDSWDLAFGSVISLLLSVLTLFGLFFLMQSVLGWGKLLMQKLSRTEISLPKFWQKHPFLAPWAIIFVCWLPYVLVRFPAALEFDAYRQIMQALGVLPFTAHSPPASSFIMGLWVKIGYGLLGSYELGLFLFVLFQTTVCSAILAYTTLTMRRLSVPEVLQLISVGIYAVATIYSNYISTLVKDVLFSCLTVLFIAILTEELFLPHSRKRCFALFGAAILMAIARNNGIFILIGCTFVGSLLCLMNIRHNRWTSLTVVLLAACIMHSIYSNALLPALGVAEGPFAEVMSIPFQQTARYVRDYPEDVTAEEAASIAAVIDYEHLGTLYDPDLSDPVKGTFTGDKTALGPYLKTWLAQFLRHPDAYLQATINNIYGFFYPNTENFVFYNGLINISDVQFQDCTPLMPLRSALSYCVKLFESFPLTMPLSNTGFQMWVAIYLVFYALFGCKDKRYAFVMLPSLIGIAVCAASPTFFLNGVRYALPVIYANPLLLSLCFRTQSKNALK